MWKIQTTKLKTRVIKCTWYRSKCNQTVSMHKLYVHQRTNYMYRCQLNFAALCATSALGISWQHLNRPNLLVFSAFRVHMYFHVWIILHHLFPYHTKMLLAGLKILTLKVRITVFVMTMVLNRRNMGKWG